MNSHNMITQSYIIRLPFVKIFCWEIAGIAIIVKRLFNKGALWKVHGHWCLTDLCINLGIPTSSMCNPESSLPIPSGFSFMNGK